MEHHSKANVTPADATDTTETTEATTNSTAQSNDEGAK